MHSPSQNDVTFWTVCPNCYFLFEYSGIYKDRCLRCQNCAKPFNAAAVQQPPPGVFVPGKDQYYCDARYFNRGQSSGSRDSFLGEKKGKNEGSKTDLENCVVISDDEKGASELQRKRKVCYKSVARNTKKKMGRGIRYEGLDI